MGAALDRNGLRPSRYYIIEDRMLVLSSEVGVLDIPAGKDREESPGAFRARCFWWTRCRSASSRTAN